MTLRPLWPGMFPRHKMQHLLSVDGGNHGPAFCSRETKVTGIVVLAAGSALEGRLEFQKLITLVVDLAQH